MIWSMTEWNSLYNNPTSPYYITWNNDLFKSFQKYEIIRVVKLVQVVVQFFQDDLLVFKGGILVVGNQVFYLFHVAIEFHLLHLGANLGKLQDEKLLTISTLGRFHKGGRMAQSIAPNFWEAFYMRNKYRVGTERKCTELSLWFVPCAQLLWNWPFNLKCRIIPLWAKQVGKYQI